MDLALIHVLRQRGFSERSWITISIPPQEDLHEHWRAFVTAYIQRSLTFQTDALPALSGLVRRLVNTSESPNIYLAGLWKADILRGLLWRCSSDSTVDRPVDYVAPSWSWASAKRPVQWLLSAHDPVYHVTVLSAQTQIKGRDPFGQVEGGQIKLRGVLLSLTIEIRFKDDPDTAPQVWVWRKKWGAPLYYDSFHECEALVGEELFCLRVSKDVNDERTGHGFERGLVLRRTHQAFTRVGILGSNYFNKWVDSSTETKQYIVLE